MLGIFGKYGIFMANYWGDLKPYNLAAYELYRNYDGKGSAIGDRAVSAGQDDVAQASIYAATESKNPGILWVVVLNKNQKDSIHGKFRIDGSQIYGQYQSYGFDAESPSIKFLRKGNLNQNKFEYDLQPLSATLFVLTSDNSASGTNGTAPGKGQF